MFSVGDYVVYGSNGVCKVTEIGPMDLPGVSKDKLFYTMTPCYIRDSSLYTPVDNTSVVIRPVMTKDEAENFVDSIKDIDGLTIKEEKRRELEY